MNKKSSFLFLPFIVFTIFLLFFQSCSREEETPPVNSPPENTNGNNENKKVHFSLDYADDIKSNSLFNTGKKRDQYKIKALQNMEELFNDFYLRFKFAPKHQIHVTISETINGATNTAYTTKFYDGSGKITKLTMHFPHVMFDKKYVRAHELTHAFIASFLFPTWVDEGLAVLNENYYTDRPTHPVFPDFMENWRKDSNGVNAVENWTEGKGIYADFDLTIWCYQYSHSIVKHIDSTYSGTFSKVFESLGHPNSQLSTKQFVSVLDSIISDIDMTKFFKEIGFELK